MDQTSLGIDAIYQATLEKESPAERKAYLDQVCQGNAQLRGKVEQLLQAKAVAARSALETPPSGLAASKAKIMPATEMPATEMPATEMHRGGQLGTQIGPYKLLQKLGEGGMGTVYLAEQKKPVARRVALKIIKPGMDSGQVIARFEAERQALAMMDHPNIAKVFDAGATSLGHPYFVMELVKGIPITQYCDENHLTPKQRLNLFVQVCHAVQHAHQKGIIHRDLKPQNILVADYDQKPVPKVIDFGIAKAITQSLTEKTVFTEIGQIVGTLEYMSPEQAKLNQLDVDTRTDVYSLGVILYQLLTGVTPVDSKRLRSAGFEEMLRIIREEEPPKPSTRISSWGASAKSLSDSRRSTMQSMKKMVQGDLDWIVMKAIEKDRARRYDTANAFADDVLRYLSDEIVSARPPSAMYRTNKFVRRNKGTLVASAVVIMLVGLSAFGILTVAEQQKANIRLQAEQKANEDRALLLVDQVLKAGQDDIRQSLGRLEPDLYGAQEKLEEIAARQSLDQKNKATLNARLALVKGGDKTYVQSLIESLLTESAGYVEVICSVLEPHKDAVVDQLWDELNSKAPDEEARKRQFRAGIALAILSPDSRRWNENHYAFVADQILRESPIDQAIYLRQVHAIAESCFSTWKKLFTGDDVFVQGSAAYALEFFARDGRIPQETIAELLAVATPKQFQILFPLIEHSANSSLLAQFQSLAATPPAEDVATEPRVDIGRARAGAGITLLRLGQLESALDMFLLESDLAGQQQSVDPEALSQFIHRCRDRGVTPEVIDNCLERLDMHPRLGADSKNAARYALLLALAEFPMADVEPRLLDKLVSQAHTWYRDDPRSSLHGATRWLLQSWGRSDLIDKVDSTPIAYSPRREWFTRVIPSLDGEQPTYITFIVFPGGEFKIGSPAGEPFRQPNETSHNIRITRPYALADREVSMTEIQAFCRLHDIPEQPFPSTPFSAGPGLNWYESVRYCRWLNEREGMTEENQPYPLEDAIAFSTASSKTELDLNVPRDWQLHVERAGYRLPTEGEWEAAARSGVSTQYFYGGDWQLIENYAWLGINTDRTPQVPRTRKPSMRGLFDMHGNLFEWCHDRFALYDSGEGEIDWTGPNKSERRVMPVVVGALTAILSETPYA